MKNTNAPIPKPCGCGNTQHEGGNCDGSHLNK
jgi:hypothetical protein